MNIEELKELLWDKRGQEKARYDYICKVQGLFNDFQSFSYHKKENAKELFELIKPWYLCNIGTTECKLAEGIYECIKSYLDRNCEDEED